MKPIISLREARALIQFPGPGKPALRTIFRPLKGPWIDAIASGGRGYSGRYHLSWCWPGKYEITVETLAEIVRIVAQGPAQATKILDNAHRRAAKALGVGLLRFSC